MKGDSAVARSADASCYAAFEGEGLDACGLAQPASRTIGMPFVGRIAPCLAPGVILLRLHGGDASDIIAGR